MQHSGHSSRVALKDGSDVSSNGGSISSDNGASSSDDDDENEKENGAQQRRMNSHLDSHRAQQHVRQQHQEGSSRGNDAVNESDANGSDDDDSAFWDAIGGDDDGTGMSTAVVGDGALLPRPPRTQADHSIIDVLAQELRQRAIPEYMEAFEIVVPDAEIVVGSIPVHELEQREHDVEEAKLRRAEIESELYRQREAHVAAQEAAARARLVHEAQQRHERLEKEKLQLVHAMQLRTRRLGYVFQQAENHLKHELARQQAHVQQLYGALAHSRVPQSRKRYRVEWQRIPVTLKLRVRMLSAVKDKLPSGHYVLVATLYDRLGGHALHWSVWDPESSGARQDQLRRSNGATQSGNQTRLGKPNFTRPFYHRGRFYHTDVRVNQSVYVVCPPECALRPGNVLILELFHLAPTPRAWHRHRRRAQQQQSDDQVVAWGALPLATPDFQCIAGKFKVPLLRGEMDPTMDKFRDLEQMIESDLSSWLCNLYVDVRHEAKRLPKPLRHKEPDVSDADDDYDLEIDERSGLYRVENNHQRYMRKLTKAHLVSPKKTRIYSGELTDDKTRHRRLPAIDDGGDTTDSEPAPPLEQQSRHHESRVSAPVFAPSSPAPDRSSDSDSDTDATSGAAPSLDTENYKFSVNDATSMETAQQKRFHMQRKLYYLRHELLVDLGAGNFRTLECWRLLTLLFLALWLRVYVHYVAQWLYLRSRRVAVYDFQPQWTTCLVKYTWRTIATSTEIGVIAAGVLGNLGVFGFLALAASIAQTFVGELPHFASTFIVCVGVAAVLDPYLVLLVDVVSHHYSCSATGGADCAVSLTASACKCVDGDAFKLYVRFLALEGSGVVGIALTLMLYAALTCGALVCVYAYVLHIHMNGRMLDVYRRVHGHEDAFFVPLDSEIGLPELRAICTHAQRWRGPRGSQRKIFVHEYTLTDPLDAALRETSVHVAVYTMELQGTRELYRHFLKTPDGAIVELFGEIGTGADGAWSHSAQHATAASLALLHSIFQDQQQHGDGVVSGSEATAAQLAALFDAL